MKSWNTFLRCRLIEHFFDQQGFWAGDGGGASGILPIATDSKNICLAWRSNRVHLGNCWGTLGGAIQSGSDPAESAKAEMHEETGYGGSIRLIPAYVFRKGTFSYYNFVGLVPYEFSFSPTSGHSWETDRIEWFPYAEITSMLRSNPSSFHPGLLSLFEQSKSIIEQHV